MENNYVTNISMDLVIGDFVISFSKYNSRVRMEIPYSGMAFYNPKGQQSDFRFLVNSVNADGGWKLIFGSAEFRIPTFLYKDSKGCFNWITKEKDGTPKLSFHISNDWTEFTLYEDNTRSNGERAFYEFGSLFAYTVLNHESCVLHGVVMEYNGMGILVTAPAGTGKTTHTRMWRDRENALILNGDRCLCLKLDGKWYAYGMPWSGSSGEYINRRVPINAIVALKRDSYNHVEIMSQLDGTLWLMQRIFAPVWKCDMQNSAFDITGELAEKIPMFELYCTPDYEAVDVLKKEIDKL